jgi:hypothetical protein
MKYCPVTRTSFFKKILSVHWVNLSLQEWLKNIRLSLRVHLYVVYDVSARNLLACAQKNSGDPFMPRKLLVGKATLNKLKSR